MLDGANAVTGAPRAHFPDALLSGGIAAIAFIAALFLWRKRPAWIWALLAMAALPGLWVVVAVRADGPVQRLALASTIEGTLSELQSHTPNARIVREDDDVLFPLTRYAAPTRHGRTGPELEVRGSALKAQCREELGRVICGAGP